MKDVERLHREAMVLAEEASLAQDSGALDKAKQLFAEALKREAEAAERLKDRIDLEPTRSILFRSAASLAIDCEDYRTAEKMVAKGLSGEPPEEIADELRDLLETVHFQRHLNLRGVVLEPRDFQMTLSGSAVGFGIADSAVFVERVRDLEALIFRTAERKTQRPFREGGSRHKALDKEVGIFLTAPRAASFAVTFKVGYGAQLALPGMGLGESVVAELLDCLEIVAGGSSEQLEKQIPNPAYRRNFLGLTRRIAPDGDAVTSVGFTAEQHGKERRVLLARPHYDLVLSADAAEPVEPTATVTIRGTLKFADSRRAGRNEIRIVDQSGKDHKVRIPEGMMDDIVRPLWDHVVVVVGSTQGRNILLVDIRPVDQVDAE